MLFHWRPKTAFFRENKEQSQHAPCAEDQTPTFESISLAGTQLATKAFVSRSCSTEFAHIKVNIGKAVGESLLGSIFFGSDQLLNGLYRAAIPTSTKNIIESLHPIWIGC